uniref:Protein kinase domain-containing protein n=1 Tax=Globisporangium ultimum (strain ATCC 200006 / CBS 805.95 / DAOM BR144) TaxID=431595 RepID=K3X2A1_GLOUD
MHHKFTIDFAYLKLRQRVSIGSSAVVYHGKLSPKTPVAIKAYMPTTVTEDTMADFSHEAALCGALNHPNAVKFYGMCVNPPTICLLPELCQRSLDVVTAAQATQTSDSRRQQFLINLGYMINAARAVTYIHSFSPTFVKIATFNRAIS